MSAPLVLLGVDAWIDVDEARTLAGGRCAISIDQADFDRADAVVFPTPRLQEWLPGRSVPIYRGAPSVASFAPAAHSYIDATDFSGAEELAEFLAAMTDAEYLEYHAWRSEGPSVEWRTRFAPFATHAFVRLAQAIETIRFGRRVAAPGTQE